MHYRHSEIQTHGYTSAQHNNDVEFTIFVTSIFSPFTLFNTLIYLLLLLIFSFQKKALSEVFAMARVAKDVWEEFQEVNSLYEKGGLKDQKVSAGDVMRGFVSLKQWHMKPLCSLSDEQKLYLLRKVK